MASGDAAAREERLGGVRRDGQTLVWRPLSDLESGIREFLIVRNGETVGRVPEEPANPFGRPRFQNLLYSDTPVQPLAEMAFDVPDDVDAASLSVRSVNTVGRRSFNSPLSR